MLRLICHHQGGYTYISKTDNGKKILQFLCISNIHIVVKIYNF
jgi:hypothetical protein